MHTIVLQSLNVFFLVFHTAIVLFNVFGWMHYRTRRYNLALLLLTLFSWVGMGLRYGVGYCICTDWHWQVRQALGYHDTAGSYIQFLIESLTPFRTTPLLVSNGSATVFLICLFMSVTLNLRDGSLHFPRLRLPI